ncbi:hypothetical protein [Dongia sp.]|uniref:hypothetical protein n=1 Tax=Dongia sp. TaxID=1977262 RepID=UPI0034A538D9
MTYYLTSPTFGCDKFCRACDDLVSHVAHSMNDWLLMPDELGVALEAVIAAGVLAVAAKPPRRPDWKRHAELEGFRHVVCDLVEQLKDDAIERNAETIAFMLATNGRIYEKLCKLIEVMEMERYDEALSVRDEVTLERLIKFRDAAILKCLSEAA